MKKQKKQNLKEKFSWNLMWRQRYLLAMSVPFVIWLIIFKYVPLWGWTMAFQDVKPGTSALPVWERPFVGLDNFVKAFTDRLFPQTMINTIGISILGIAVGTITSILFALVLNEICFTRFKNIIASIAKMLFNDGGAFDTMLGTDLHIMSTNSPVFWFVVCMVDVWKEMGWNAIIYLSAMAGIDQGLYEAAKVDGANRFQRIWHVTLPCIRPTVIVLLIMSIGSALNVGMERQMLLSNSIVQDHAMVLSWFAYVRGIGSNNYGLGTAIGVFQSVVGVILLFLANKVAGMIGEDKLV